jgi:hypothetical protein
MENKVTIELTLTEETLVKLVHESTNIKLDEVENLIMDEILASLSDKDAKLIENNIKPDGEWARGVWWTVQRIKAAILSLKKEGEK